MSNIGRYDNPEQRALLQRLFDGPDALYCIEKWNTGEGRHECIGAVWGAGTPEDTVLGGTVQQLHVLGSVYFGGTEADGRRRVYSTARHLEDCHKGATDYTPRTVAA